MLIPSIKSLTYADAFQLIVMDYPVLLNGRNCDFPAMGVEGSEKTSAPSFTRKRRITLQQFTHVALFGSMLAAKVFLGGRRKQTGQTMPGIRKWTRRLIAFAINKTSGPAFASKRRTASLPGRQHLTS